MELKLREITGTSPGPHLLITGGVHGDEFEPMAAIRELMSRVDPAKLRGKLTLVPIVNEPAFLRGQRTAEDGLDLARTCPGRADGSITEQIADALSRLIRTADYYIDLHTGGTEFTLLPLVGYMLHPNAKVLEAQRRMAKAFNVPIIWGTNPNLNGRSLSVSRDANIPGLYAEWGGGGGCDLEGIVGYVNGCLGVMAELGMIDYRQPAAVKSQVIEDARENSGHLQICNTSPIDGFFEPAVKLGDHVNAGDSLGTVVDVLGGDRRDVKSGQTGLVFCLHTFRRVKQGVAVAVVLEGA